MSEFVNTSSQQHYYHRDNCRLCLSTDICLAIPFKHTPIAEKYTSQPAINTPFFPVDLYMCNHCGHVQILDVIDPEYLWSDYTYHSGQTQGIIDHFKDVVNKIVYQHGPFKNNFVIDVGSNDGTLLRGFKAHDFKVLGIDPAKEIAQKATESGIETIADLMTSLNAQKIVEQYGKADLVTAFNVFAHADEMKDLLKGITITLDENGLFVFEVSYLKDIIDKMLIGTIFHEHLCNHSLTPLQLFLAAEGLEIIHVEHVSIQGGSIIGFAQHKNGPRALQPSVKKMLEDEAKYKLHSIETMKHFISRFNMMKQQVHTIISSIKSSHGVIAGYGAARSGPMLIAQFELETLIDEIYDDHPQKVGLYSPGDSILVKSTGSIISSKPELTVILAWIHAKNIVKKHIDYLEQNGMFLTISPEVQLITKENYSEFIS
ncbi:methyltransferase domain-containing protein [Marinomonas sp. 2405UD68-3]|uniref:methyltransferase domain-containing protein n=1 Tax=Marinomonas sp. 2405UD68-3 TaxID=3391835 RepID=UPI0039C8DF5E